MPKLIPAVENSGRLAKTAAAVFIACACGALYLAPRRPSPDYIPQKSVTEAFGALKSGDSGRLADWPGLSDKEISAQFNLSCSAAAKAETVIFQTADSPRALRIALDPAGRLHFYSARLYHGRDLAVTDYETPPLCPAASLKIAVSADAAENRVSFSVADAVLPQDAKGVLVYDGSSPRFFSSSAVAINSAVVSREFAGKSVWRGLALLFLKLLFCAGTAVSLCFAAGSWAIGRPERKKYARAAAIAAGFIFLLGCATLFTYKTESGKGYYGELAAAFSRGSLSLPRAVPPELLSVRDPYQYGYAWKYGIWDYSMYGGKFYLYFGPAPALARLAFFNRLPEHIALIGYALAWAVFFYLSVLSLRRRYFPEAGGKIAVFAGLTGAFNPLNLYLLNMPGVYSEAALAGAAFGAGGICFYLLARDNAKPVYYFISGLFFALAMASRVSTVFAVLPFIALETLNSLRARNWRFPVALCAGPFCAGLALLLYNYARFDNLFEFGVSYQYNATRAFVAAGHFFSGEWFAGHIKDYFLRLPHFSPGFPFISGSGPGGVVSDTGVFTLFLWSPVAALGAGLVFLRNRAAAFELDAVLLSSLAALAVTACNVATGVRYMSDFAFGFTLAGAAGLFSLYRVSKKGARAALVMAAVLTVVIGVCTIFMALRETKPELYAALMRLFGVL
ncbi:MAG: hypothetical protein PHP45_03595 [Elusimicrobiales bacterium]|nr:hypothetical protein [Elusimicrobiales bacterium]